MSYTLSNFEADLAADAALLPLIEQLERQAAPSVQYDALDALCAHFNSERSPISGGRRLDQFGDQILSWIERLITLAPIESIEPSAKHCCELLPRLFALFGLVAQRHLSLTHVHRLLLLVHRCCLPFDSLQAERLSQAVSTLYSTFNHSTAGGFFPASPSPALSLAAINSGSDMVTSAPQLISTLDHSFLDADSIYSRVSESTSVTVPSQLSEPLIPGQCPIWLRSWLCSWILLSIKVSLRVADTLSLKQLTPFRSNVQPTSNIHTPRNFEPYSFFEFNGIDAALTVDTLLEKWPGTESYSTLIWLCRRQSSSTGDQYLYSFATPKGHGMHVSVDVSGRLKFGVHLPSQRFPSEVVLDAFRLAYNQWYCVCIQHSKPTAFSRFSGLLKVFVDGKIKLEADLIYPSFTEPFLHCTIGASIDNQQLISNSWCGRLGAIYFFSSILTPELQQTLLEQGPDHCIRVSTDSERATILKSVKKIATTAISTFSSLFSVFNSSDSSSNSASNSHQNVLSNIAFAYHAANTQDRVCLDCSPLDPSTCQKQSSEVEYAVTAKMSGSLQACVHSKPADVFFLSFGGLLSLLPMFAHIQTLQSQSSEMTLFPLAISTLSELLSQSSLNQSHFLSHHGFAMLGLLLQQFEFPIDSFSLQSVQRLLCSLSYSSFYLAADTLKRIDNKSEHDESDLSVNFQQSLDWSQDFNSNLDILSVSNGNSSLFSEAFEHLLLDFRVWHRCVDSVAVVSSSSPQSASTTASNQTPSAPLSRSRSPPTECLQLARFALQLIQLRPNFFRNICTPTRLLDNIRMYLSYSAYCHDDMICNQLTADAWTLQELHAVRSVWMHCAHVLITAPASNNSTQGEVNLRDVEYLMHACNDSDSLSAAECFELLRQLLTQQPSLVLQHITALGGPLIFVSSLSQSKHEHTRVSCIHMLSSLLQYGNYLPDNVHHLFSLLGRLLQSKTFGQGSYLALLECAFAVRPTETNNFVNSVQQVMRYVDNCSGSKSCNAWFEASTSYLELFAKQHPSLMGQTKLVLKWPSAINIILSLASDHNFSSVPLHQCLSDISIIFARSRESCARFVRLPGWQLVFLSVRASEAASADMLSRLCVQILSVLLSHCILFERNGWRVSGREMLSHIQIISTTSSAVAPDVPLAMFPSPSPATAQHLCANLLWSTVKRVLVIAQTQRDSLTSLHMQVLRSNIAGLIESLEAISYGDSEDFELIEDEQPDKQKRRDSDSWLVYENNSDSQQRQQKKEQQSQIFGDMWPILLEIVPLLSDLQVKLQGSHVRMMVRLLLDCTEHAASLGPQELVTSLSILQFMVEKLADNTQPGEEVQGFVIGETNNLTYSFNDIALHTAQRLCSLTHVLERGRAAHDAETEAKKSTHEDPVDVSIQAILRVSQSIVERTAVFMLAPLPLFRLDPSSVVNEGVAQALEQRWPSQWSEAREKLSPARFTQWEQAQLQRVVDSKVNSCPRLNVSNANALTAVIGAVGAQVAGAGLSLLSVFGLSHTSAMPGAHIMAAVPLLVDDSARLVPKVRFDEFPDIAAKLFEALIMFVNDRMRVMSEYESQRASEISSYAQRERSALSTNQTKLEVQRKHHADEFTRKADRLYQQTCYADISRRAVAEAFRLSLAQSAQQNWLQVQMTLAQWPSPWFAPHALFGRALGLSNSSTSELRWLWTIGDTEDELRMKHIVRKQLASETHVPTELTQSQPESSSEPVDNVKLKIDFKINAVLAEEEDDDVPIEVDTSLSPSDENKSGPAVDAASVDASEPAIATSTDIMAVVNDVADSESVANESGPSQSKETSSTGALAEDDSSWEQVGPAAPAKTDTTVSLIALPQRIAAFACTLVLPIDSIDGTLEFSSTHIRFTASSRYCPANERNAAAADAMRLHGKFVHFVSPSLDGPRTRAYAERKWRTSDLQAVYQRRFQLQRTALEFFFTNGKNFFFDFSARDARDRCLTTIVQQVRPSNLIPLCSRTPVDLLRRSGLTERWQRREISNFEYLMHLNTISGRTFNDLNQYPVFPWILADYTSPTLDLNNPNVYRDLRKPVGALDEQRLEQILMRFNQLNDDNDDEGVPAFHYGSHYSNAAVVLFYLFRLEPFAALHVELQGGRFDYSDRLFGSIGRAWQGCLTSLSCFRELVPEFFYLPEFLQNPNRFDFGRTQAGAVIDAAELPTWASSAEDFVRQHRMALESDHVSAHLHNWIDLIWGFKQRGPEAVTAHNLFFHLTYEGAVDLESVTDRVMRDAIKAQIAQFGQTPMQLFKTSHPARQARRLPMYKRLALTAMSGFKDARDSIDSIAADAESNIVQPVLLTGELPLHRPVSCVMLCVNEPVVALLPCSDRLISLSSSCLVGQHAWWSQAGSPSLPTPYFIQSSNSHDQQLQLMQFQIAQNLRTLPSAELEQIDDMSQWSAGAPQSQSPSFGLEPSPTVLINPHHPILLSDNLPTSTWLPTVLSNNGKHMYTVSATSPTSLLVVELGSPTGADDGNNALRTRVVQVLQQHRKSITAICVTRDGTLVTGSADCTVRVWDHENTIPASSILSLGLSVVRPNSSDSEKPLKEHARHVLRGHRSTVNLLCAHSELDVCVSSSLTENSDDGLLLMHSLRSGQVLSRLQLPWLSVRGTVRRAVPTLLTVSSQGRILVYCKELSCVLSCGFNGRPWQCFSVDSDDSLYVLQCSADGLRTLTAGQRGRVIMRRTSDFRPLQQFEPSRSPICCAAFSEDNNYVFSGTQTGQCFVYIVDPDMTDLVELL